MESVIVAKDQLLHFNHPHSLTLVHMQHPTHKNDYSDDEDEDKDEDDFVEDNQYGGKCNMCEEYIWSFHLCYYHCDSCDFSLHEFCAKLPKTLQNHPLHPGHNLLFCHPFEFRCFVCNLKWTHVPSYYCMSCYMGLDVICATAAISEQKINHPSHPHRLERMPGPTITNCVACGNKHEGVFFLCTTCPWFRINQDCALLPSKLVIQNHTNGTFVHSHPLTLAYSSTYSDRMAKFNPNCRVCDGRFYSHLWIYKCDKCIYYVHVDCATSNKEPFMSIFLPPGIGKTYKNFKEGEHPNLLHCPFHDEGDNLLKRHMSNQKELTSKEHDGEILNHSSHQHSLIIVNKQASNDKNLVSLHDPMKKIQLLCDGCVKPIMTVPFYMCCRYADEQCCFVLHERCARLPSKLQNYDGHPKHTLFLMQKVNSEFFGVFECAVCGLQSNGFAYGCTTCEYFVDINCAFIPEEITHDAHPNHLLTKVKISTKISIKCCKACLWYMSGRWNIDSGWGFHCPACDFYIHVVCALLLPRMIKHKCDKHPLSLRYNPVENHISKYFCEVCEDVLNPWVWFYHCTACAQSMHLACVPVILQYEKAPPDKFPKDVYRFLNVKFGGTLEIKRHSHRLFSFVQGLESDGNCFNCGRWLEYEMIFKCFECKFALHYNCASSFVN